MSQPDHLKEGGKDSESVTSRPVQDQDGQVPHSNTNTTTQELTHQEKDTKSHHLEESDLKPDPQYDYAKSSLQQDREEAIKCEKRMMERMHHHHDEGSGSAEVKDKNHGQAEGKGQDQDQEREKAAGILQAQYRSHAQRRQAQGMNLTSSARWTDGLHHRKLSRAASEQHEGQNDPTSRWHRTGLYASQISAGSKQSPSQSNKNDQPSELSEKDEMNRFGRNDKEKQMIKEERAASKQMEAQYWLEMVDTKHRYGTNLKWYHQHWNDTVDTEENFFHWLDLGPGKNLDLEQCPRSRLEKEKIVYLTAEQRQNYRVVFSEEGLLVWAKTGEPLDTTKYFRDAGPTEGIVPMTEEEVKDKEKKEKEERKKRKQKLGQSDSSSSSESGSEEDIDPDDKEREGVRGYADKGGTAGQGKGVKQLKARVNYYLSPRAVMDRMLRDTINKNTWLFVADMQNNLYVGLKKTGQFQHSSFLFGGRVTSAGLIKVDKGKLTSLSPLSGHYRAGTMHFKAFVRSLEEAGVDMSHVMISKSVVTIRGIEKFGAATKKKKILKDKLKVKLGLGSGQSPEEEKKEKDHADKEKITKDAQQDRVNQGQGQSQENDKDGENIESVKHRPGNPRHRSSSSSIFTRPLPGDGKKVEDMPEHERTERGIALIQRAFERAARIEEGEEEKEGETKWKSDQLEEEGGDESAQEDEREAEKN